MVVAAKTYSSFSWSGRLERAFFLDDGLQTTTGFFRKQLESPILRGLACDPPGPGRRTELKVGFGGYRLGRLLPGLIVRRWRTKPST